MLASSSRNATESYLCFHFLGVHGAHGASIIETFSELNFLRQWVPQDNRFVYIGDWNINQLPALDCDPWSQLPCRSVHLNPKERRALLAAWVDGHGVNIVLPDAIEDFPQWQYDCEFCCAPVSRVPSDTSSDAPSLLGSVVSSCKFVSSCRQTIMEASIQ